MFLYRESLLPYFSDMHCILLVVESSCLSLDILVNGFVNIQFHSFRKCLENFLWNIIRGICACLILVFLEQGLGKGWKLYIFFSTFASWRKGRSMYEQPLCNLKSLPKSAYLFQTCFQSHAKAACLLDHFLISALKVLAWLVNLTMFRETPDKLMELQKETDTRNRTSHRL